MVHNVNASLVILTYKGKFLLALRDDKPDIISPNCWCFIGGTKEETETFEETCRREVEEEIGIKINQLTFLKIIKYEDRRKYFYHSNLTEQQVKDIVLHEGQKYDFFTIGEIKNLALARSTKLFVDQNEDILSEVEKRSAQM